jgi:CzcA family heavy metal efflux pump
MLSALVGLSLRYRWVVLGLSLLLLGWGAYGAKNAKYDVFPDFVPPQVTIQAEAPGFTPEQVELLVTRPIEAAVNGVGNMDSMRSESIQGLSVVTVVFVEGSNIQSSRQMLAERLGELAGRLPNGVRAPTVSPLTSATMDLLKVGLVSKGPGALTPFELRAFADTVIRPRLLAVPGVARCIVFGGETKELQILVHPEKLQALGLSLSDVSQAVKNANSLIGVGFVDTRSQRIAVQMGTGLITPAELAQVTVNTPTGQPVPLGSLADITYGAAPKFGDALVMGEPGIILSLSSQYGANTLEVTHEVEEALEALAPTFAANHVTSYNALHRPASFIETSLANIRSSLFLGAILVAVILLLFVGNLRIALISLTAIPLSLLTAVATLSAWGVTINTLTLGGLAIAIGEVVDDAIIDAENIIRRLRENHASASPRSVTQVILDASLEVRSAVVYATFLVALVFLPILTLSGIQGKFFGPLALSYIFATMASLGVAVVLTPVLCLILLGKGQATERAPKESRLKQVYLRLVGLLIDKPKASLAGVAILCLGAYWLMPASTGEILPGFREGHYVVQLNTTAGSSLAEMTRLGQKLSQEFLAVPEVATVEQQIGRATQGEDTFGPNRCEFHIELKPGADAEEAAAGIHAALARHPGTEAEVLTFLGDRISETLTGETAPFVVNIFGESLATLDAKAMEVKKVLEGMKAPAASQIKIKAAPSEPRLLVQPRLDRLAALGLKVQDINDVLLAALQGNAVAQSLEDGQSIDLSVHLGHGLVAPEELGDLPLRTARGAMVPLREVATIRLGEGRNAVLHEGARRRQTVTCAPKDERALAEFSDVAEKTLREKVILPAGTYFEFSGDAKASHAAQDELILHSLVAGFGVVLLLFIVTGHWRNTALILANLPFALAGGALSLAFGQYCGKASGLSLGALVGFVTLFGITTRNSVMLLSHYQNLVEKEGRDWNALTAIQGAADRLLPILMTALVTGIGLLPLAWGSGEAGREIEGPMAIVILGGLLTSTLLNLLVLPALALNFGHFAKHKNTDK